MVKAYSTIETEVINQFVSHFSTYLSELHVSAGDLDKVIDALSTTENEYGILFEFARGRDPYDDTFKKPRWVWVIGGIFFIRYSDEIETNLRRIIDLLPSVFDSDHTLNNTTPLARITIVDTPEPSVVGEMSMYWLPFVVEVWAQ